MSSWLSWAMVVVLGKKWYSFATTSCNRSSNTTQCTGLYLLYTAAKFLHRMVPVPVSIKAKAADVQKCAQCLLLNIYGGGGGEEWAVMGKFTDM